MSVVARLRLPALSRRSHRRLVRLALPILGGAVLMLHQTSASAAQSAQVSLRLAAGGLTMSGEARVTHPQNAQPGESQIVIPVDDATGSGEGWAVSAGQTGGSASVTIEGVRVVCAPGTDCAVAHNPVAYPLVVGGGGEANTRIAAATIDSGMGSQLVILDVLAAEGSTLDAVPWSLSVTAGP